MTYRAEIGTHLTNFIYDSEEQERKEGKLTTGSLSRILRSIEDTSKLISSEIRMAGLADIIGTTGKVNIQGEIVKKLDELTNYLLVENLSKNERIYAIASEEMEKPIFPEKGKEGNYIISFDPLDGSSNIDVNVSIGTIFSIKKKIDGTEKDFLQPGKEQVAAGYVLYGNSTMLVYTTGNGVNFFTLDTKPGLYLLSESNWKMPDYGHVYSFNDSKYYLWDEKDQDFVEKFKQVNKIVGKNMYTARYIGSLVADVHRTLIQGGIFANPTKKLRLLYEAQPMAFIVEQAGGIATNRTENIMDVVPIEIHERIPLYLGSKKNMEDYKRHCNSRKYTGKKA